LTRAAFLPIVPEIDFSISVQGVRVDEVVRGIVRFPISTAELERRWAETRKAMATQGIDCLVMQNSNEFLGGYVRWFTDIPAVQGYPVTVLFPADGEMTMIASGGKPAPPAAPQSLYRGVKERIILPYFLSMNYTNTWDAEAAVGELKARASRRVGIVGKAFMSAAFYECLVGNLAGIELVDFTDPVDYIKAVKSPEEVGLVRKAAAMQDTAWAAVAAIARPGKREYEIRSELERLLSDMGSEEQWVMIGSAPEDGRPRQKPNYLQTRTLEAGDQLNVMIEVNGPGGMYTEMARTLCLGDPPKALLSAWGASRDAQLRTAALLKPGARPADILKAHNDFMVSRGYPPEGRLYAHGQGYDMVERPSIVAEETMLIAANMNIAVHPFAITERGYGYACDNYLVTETGAERVHKTPIEVFVA
jgi:Xaa-Pro aminopeptidase